MTATLTTLQELEDELARLDAIDTTSTDGDPFSILRAVGRERSPIEKRAEAARRWARSVPRRFESAHIGEDTPSEIRAWVDEWPTMKNLLLLGPVGIGKTHIAWAALGYLAAVHALPTAAWREFAGWLRLCIDQDGLRPDSYPGAVVVKGVDALDALRPDGGAGTVDFVMPKLLVIDDLAAGKTSEWAAERLLSVIDQRWEEGLPLVVTSNLSAGELEEVLGSAAYNRLRHGAVVSIGSGTSRRTPTLG